MQKIITLLFGILLLSPSLSEACRMCFLSSDIPNDPSLKAVQAGMLFLLGVVLCVMCFLVSFFINVVRRSKMIEKKT